MGLSRDDAGKFLPAYVEAGILPKDPFVSLDQRGRRARSSRWPRARARRRSPKLKLGVCGEHGGDPASIEFFQKVGLDYVSCSPFRVPIARLAAAQAALRGAGPERRPRHGLRQTLAENAVPSGVRALLALPLVLFVSASPRRAGATTAATAATAPQQPSSCPSAVHAPGRSVTSRPRAANCNGDWYCWSDQTWYCAPPDSGGPGDATVMFDIGAARRRRQRRGAGDRRRRDGRRRYVEHGRRGRRGLRPPLPATSTARAPAEEPATPARCTGRASRAPSRARGCCPRA